MRVLWTHSFQDGLGSAGVFVKILLGQMRESGVEVDTHNSGPLRSPYSVFRAAAAIRKRSKDYDLVHSQYGSGCALVTSFARGPKLVTLRGSDFYGMECGSIGRRLHGALARRLSLWSMRRFRRVIVVSNRMRNEIENLRYAHPRIDVIPSGVNLRKFQPMDRRAVREHLGLPDDGTPCVLLASHLSDNPVKRLRLAESAVRRLRQRIGRVEFQVATGVPHDAMPLWINASDVVLLTSTHEGWPNIIKEAIACNVPFVSTDVSDLRQIADRESNCTVVEADAAALADALQQALKAGRSVNLRRHVEPMELSAIARRLLSIYEEVLGDRASRLPTAA